MSVLEPISFCAEGSGHFAAIVKLSLDVHPSFIQGYMYAGPKQRVRCHVRRAKHALRGDVYQLFVERASTPNGGHLVLSARRRKKSTTPQFVIALSGMHTTGDDLKKSASTKIIATVVGNRQGTTYRCFMPAPMAASMLTISPGMTLTRAPVSACPDDPSASSGVACSHLEVAAVKFKQAGVARVGGVRQFFAIVPDPSPPPNMVLLPDEAADLLDLADGQEDRRHEGVIVAHSVQPVYDEVKKMYVMDFQRRVTKGSPKNCQLRALQSKNAGAADSIFLFGKNDKDFYAMDFSYPFSLVQAFSVAIACFDTRSFSH